MKEDHRTAPLDDPTRALLDHAWKLACVPAESSAEDVEALRAHGFDDRDITDLVHNVAIFAYINRVALGLGLELEPFMEAGGELVAPDAPLP